MKLWMVDNRRWRGDTLLVDFGSAAIECANNAPQALLVLLLDSDEPRRAEVILHCIQDWIQTAQEPWHNLLCYVYYMVYSTQHNIHFVRPPVIMYNYIPNTSYNWLPLHTNCRTPHTTPLRTDIPTDTSCMSPSPYSTVHPLLTSWYCRQLGSNTYIAMIVILYIIRYNTHMYI